MSYTPNNSKQHERLVNFSSDFQYILIKVFCSSFNTEHFFLSKVFFLIIHKCWWVIFFYRRNAFQRKMRVL